MRRWSQLLRIIRSPRHLLALSAVLALAPTVVLVYLGWSLASEDRALELQRIRERHKQAVKLIVTALGQKVAATMQELRDPAVAPGLASDDSQVVILGVRKEFPKEPDAVFRLGEDDEYGLRYDSAIEKFRALASNDNAAVRAGALFRLARVLRKAKRLPEALEVYAQLERIDGASVSGGLPADLVARHARCGVLNELGRSMELRDEADRLQADLDRGNWALDGPTYRVKTTFLDEWLGKTSHSNVAEAADRLWLDWRKAPLRAIFAGRGADPLDGGATLLWRADGQRLAVFAAGRRFVEREWLATLEPLLESQNVVLSFDSLADEDAVRLGSETGLPWALHIASADLATDLAQSNGRRRVMLGGLGILLLVVAAASYFIARVILRELTAARLQSDFVAAVSHEFRIPLTSMRQVTEILNDERVADPERVRSYHRTQARATDRLQRLVETLLDFGRMEAGAKPYRLQPLDLAAWLRGVVADFQAEAAASGHKIELDAQEVGMVDADSEALAHAMRNLLDNAVKYSPQSNTVWVELAALGDRCAIRVRDSGFGIPHDEQKHVFQKFFRGSAAKSNAIKGTGVGLAMVEHIVAAHHGSIELDSQPGKGSTFTVYLPLNVND